MTRNHSQTAWRLTTELPSCKVISQGHLTDKGGTKFATQQQRQNLEGVILG